MVGPARPPAAAGGGGESDGKPARGAVAPATAAAGAAAAVAAPEAVFGDDGCAKACVVAGIDGGGGGGRGGPDAAASNVGGVRGGPGGIEIDSAVGMTKLRVAGDVRGVRGEGETNGREVKAAAVTGVAAPGFNPPGEYIGMVNGTRLNAFFGAEAPRAGPEGVLAPVPVPVPKPLSTPKARAGAGSELCLGNKGMMSGRMGNDKPPLVPGDIKDEEKSVSRLKGGRLLIEPPGKGADAEPARPETPPGGSAGVVGVGAGVGGTGDPNPPLPPPLPPSLLPPPPPRRVRCC